LRKYEARFPRPKNDPSLKQFENQEIVISYVAVPPALTAHRPLRDWRGEDVSARAHESAALEHVGGLERPVAFQSTGCALSSRFLRDGAEKYLRANHSVLGIITIDCEHAHIVIG